MSRLTPPPAPQGSLVLSRPLALVRWQVREMGLAELTVKRGWSSAPRRLSPRFHRPALAEGSAPGAPPTGAPPPRPPLVVQYPSSLEGLALRSHTSIPHRPADLCASPIHGYSQTP